MRAWHLVPTLLLVAAPALAHGDPPSRCTNAYSSDIVAMTVAGDGEPVDVFAHPGAAIEASLESGYVVTMTLRTAETSARGNGEPGMTWLGTNAYGFGLGRCIDDSGPSKDHELVIERVRMGQGYPGMHQSVYWNGLGGGQVAYEVRWRD